MGSLCAFASLWGKMENGVSSLLTLLLAKETGAAMLYVLSLKTPFYKKKTNNQPINQKKPQNLLWNLPVHISVEITE